MAAKICPGLVNHRYKSNVIKPCYRKACKKYDGLCKICFDLVNSHDYYTRGGSNR
jgi:hypothetical protein